MHSDKLLQVLMRGCRGGLSAIRSITKLQPSDGAGGKVFADISSPAPTRLKIV